MKEVVQAGWKVSGQKLWTGQQSWQVTPDVDEIYEALEECYGLGWDKRNALAQRGRKHALNYDVDKVVVDHMLPALREVEERIGVQPEAVAA